MANNKLNFEAFKNSKIPKSLTKKETIYYFNELNNGDKEARNILIESNIRLVLYRVYNKFLSLPYDKEDLVSIGLIGLIKSIDTYDITKKADFSTYATRCIDNEILMFNRKNEKYNLDQSFENEINKNAGSEKLTISDIIKDRKINIATSYEQIEINLVLNELVESLPEREKKIIKLYFGFYGGKTYSQRELTKMFGISQAQVSRILKSVLNQLLFELQNRGLIEIKTKNKNNQKVLK